MIRGGCWRAHLVGLLLALGSVTAGAGDFAGYALDQFSVESEGSAGALIRFTNLPPSADLPTLQFIDSPFRVLIDFPGMTGVLHRMKTFPQGLVESATVLSTDERTRVILVLRAKSRPTLRLENGVILLSLTPDPAFVPGAGKAAPAPPRKGRARAAAAVNESLLLDIEVLDRKLNGIFLAERVAGGRLAVPADAWSQARLVPMGDAVTLSDGQSGYVLDAVPGLRYEVDRSNLRLKITAPPAAFTGSEQSIGMGKRPVPVPPPPGAYLNYNLSTTHAGGNSNYGALVEGVAFNGWGSLVVGAAVRANERETQIVRTDTYWRKDLPGPMETLMVGDTEGTGGMWSRPVRFGGVRYARNFNLAPGFVTYPMPSISGEAALPSTLDVLINNRRSSSTNVQTGPFELSNVPVVTGAGEMQLVVRDLLGRESVIRQSYYVAPQLLAKGLSDFSYEAGALRENYGTRNSDYGDVFGAATYRLGFTDTLTGEVRAELQGDRQAAGAGLTAVLGQIATVGIAGGYAVSDGEQGGRYLLGLQRTSPAGGASLAWGRSDRGYRELGTDALADRTKDLLAASAGMAIGAGMNLGASYTRQTKWSGDNFALAGVSFNMPLPWDMSLSLNASKQLEAGGGWAATASLTAPLGDRRTAAARSGRRPDGKLVNEVHVSQSRPSGPGWGWWLGASDDPAQQARGALGYNSNNGELTAEANSGTSGTALRLGANGSVGWLQGLPFATRPINDGAFAVVHVGKVEGVPVFLSNQMVATTNRNGLALVPNLLPYQENNLTIKPDELPLDVEIKGVQQSVVPYARSGAFVDFPVKRSRDALVILRKPDGSPVPAGARVKVSPGNQEFFVSKRGEVYLMDLTDSNRIGVRWKDGGCELPLELGHSVPGTVAPQIGPLNCGGGK